MTSWKLCPVWGRICRLVVSFHIASLHSSWCQRSLGCVPFRQKLFPVISDVTGAGRLSDKCTWAKQYRFHKFKASCKNHQPLQAVGCRALRVGGAGGDSRVTWASAWSLHCKVEPAWTSTGNSCSCFSSPSARQSWHLLHLPDTWKDSSHSDSVFWDPTTCR